MMKIKFNNGILCTAEQLVIMAANTDDFNEVIDYVMRELEGYNEACPPSELGGVGLCIAMFKMGIGSGKTWSIPEIDKELLDMVLEVVDEGFTEVNMADVIELYVGCMLASGQWSYPL